MVKSTIDPSGDRFIVYLNARHIDIDSFRQNIQYYIEQVMEASEGLRERYFD